MDPSPPSPIRARARALQRVASPYVSVLAFVGGVVWDGLTLVRVDRLADNLLLTAYLVALLALVVVEDGLTRPEEEDGALLARLRPRRDWITYGVQFFTGGLVSAYLIFYTRSATWGPTLAFVALLATLMVVNEFVQGWLRRAWLRLGLAWFLAFAYLRLAVPVFTLRGGPWLSAVAGLLASAAILGVGVLMVRGQPPSLRRRRLGRTVGVVAGAALLAGLLELGGLIPPAPFALLEVGAFHEVRVDRTDGRRDVVLRHERSALPWVDDDTRFRWRPGEAAHVFTAVFAPTGLRLTVRHRWWWWDEGADAWVQTDLIDVTPQEGFVGGRDGGYRTWSRKARLREGAWRVTVEDGHDREIGRYGFTVEAAPEQPAAVWEERRWR